MVMNLSSADFSQRLTLLKVKHSRRYSKILFSLKTWLDVMHCFLQKQFLSNDKPSFPEKKKKKK